MTDLITPSGPVATTQGGTIYIKRFGDWSRFVWGGECVYIQDIADERGGLNITTRADALEGGIQRDGVLVDPPGNVTTTLSMKRLRGDKLKSQLTRCFWLFDKRTQCNDFDDPTGWSEIERVYRAKVGTRTTTPGTSIMEANAEDMVNFDVTALEDWDIYRVHLEEENTIVTGVLAIVCVDVCHGERCVNCGDSETDAVIVAGTQDDGLGTSPYILVNENGGDVDSWTALDIDEWDTFAVDGIACLGSWGGAVSHGAGAALSSRDRFATRIEITSTDMTAHAPNCIDANMQTFVVIGADDGYIYISRDGLASVETSLAGTITALALTEIQIAPSNSLVVYAASETDDVILKSENGGDTWYQVAVTGTAGGITALCVHPDDSNMVLVGTDKSEIYQTTDGGETWTEQATIPGLNPLLDTFINDIDTAGGGVWFAAISDDTAIWRVYVNYEDGASGAWEYFNPADGETYDLTMEPLAIAAVSPNRCVAVGGDGATGDMVALLA